MRAHAVARGPEVHQEKDVVLGGGDVGETEGVGEARLLEIIAELRAEGVSRDEFTRSGKPKYYAVVGGPQPGVHYTLDYDASVRSVVEGYSGVKVFGPRSGVRSFEDARRRLTPCVGYRDAKAYAQPGDESGVIVWVHTAAGYVGRLGSPNGPVVVAAMATDGGGASTGGDGAREDGEATGHPCAGSVDVRGDNLPRGAPSVFDMPPGATVFMRRAPVSGPGAGTAECGEDASSMVRQTSDECDTNGDDGSISA